VAGVAPGRFADVMGLAYAQCAGTMQAHVEGSIALPLQIGLAARAAVSAVDLVQAGLTGPHDVIEGPFGYFRLFDEGDPAVLTAALGGRWRIGEVSTKPFPSGRASHGVLGALRELRREGLAAAEVERIDAIVPPLVARLVGRQFNAEMTPAYARLCLQLLAALMLADGVVDPRRFTPATFADPAIAALAARVQITVDANPDPNALSPQRLVVHPSGGRTIERTIPATIGAPGAPMPPGLAAEKLALARALAPPETCPDIFTDAPGYFIRGA
jgi:2-methylcitrate dehydratase PrpD